MDTFTTMQPTWVMPEPAPGEKPHPSWQHDVRPRGFLSGWYQCIRALALAGNNVIADAGFLKIEWLLEQIDALDGIEALYVGVFCPLEEVERRELAAGTVSRDTPDRSTTLCITTAPTTWKWIRRFSGRRRWRK
jgi:hypothetical protein